MEYGDGEGNPYFAQLWARGRVIKHPFHIVISCHVPLFRLSRLIIIFSSLVCFVPPYLIRPHYSITFLVSTFACHHHFERTLSLYLTIISTSRNRLALASALAFSIKLAFYAAASQMS